ncbi:GM10284 [Drosophila sechellia]|uniref:GM10284 n=1 Tax=Drosophila sechellia TaxID=7238 RepID=B4ICG5_DROSE|nr:GM10284 [Drosophila sechellia]
MAPENIEFQIRGDSRKTDAQRFHDRGIPAEEQHPFQPAALMALDYADIEFKMQESILGWSEREYD